MPYAPPWNLDVDRLRVAIDRVAADLITARGGSSHWVGKLSTSALSTATATVALRLVAAARAPSDAARLLGLADRGLDWLAAHANEDGGWGDTTRSRSNLSTTTLCHAALSCAPASDARREALGRAEQWIRAHVGSTEPEDLARAVIARYGEDRTFSVPILTHCALAGTLGAGRDAWRHVIPLPFELAALPASCYAAVGLPVVSYALPALIAIGQVRHEAAPSRNPLTRAVRRWLTPRTLRLLERIQPTNGGFLEATPLTSFVTMSLAGAGRADHPVARKGVAFLEASVREDGSWPIDTNLATWVSTLSIGALADAGRLETLPALDKRRLRDWLLAQQYRSKHPYTESAPGAWAWTDLPGGVPDADDTAGALLALRKLAPAGADGDVEDAALLGVRWLLGIQNRDGGVPTFCRGWGKLPFDRSGADLTAHALRAWVAWRDDLDPIEPGIGDRIDRAIGRGVTYLESARGVEGEFAPLWFGNEHSPDEGNPTYGTARVATALAEVARGGPDVVVRTRAATLHARALAWLAEHQRADGGWGGGAGAPSSVEETALAIDALADPEGLASAGRRRALEAGLEWLLDAIERGAVGHATPIGFYFAKLWYFEELYPRIFTVGALGRALRAMEG